MHDKINCAKIKFAFKEYEKEIMEHGIIKRYEKYRTKLKSLKKGSWLYKRYEKKIKEYGDYIKAYHGLERAYKDLCLGKKVKPYCRDLELSRRIWEEEIEKYKVIIFLTRKEEFYDQIKDSIDDILDSRCNC